MSLQQTLMDKLIVGIAAAATLAGGGTVLNNWYTNGQQQVLIEQTLTINDKLDSIKDTVNRVESDVDHMKREQDRIRDSLGADYAAGE